MKSVRPIHPDFLYYLEMKEQGLIELFKNLREYILDLAPHSNELLYHTHALTALFSVSDKMSDAICFISVYRNHMNLGFSNGTLLKDSSKLLQGTGKLMRHIPINSYDDYRNEEVKALIIEAINIAIEDMEKPSNAKGLTISKIKKK